MSHTRPLPLLALTAGALLVSVLAPRPAAACGGFFCSAIQLVPVEQNAERILFEINDDDTITTIVEIRYVGDPDEFSWVVPVPADEVDLAVTPIETLVMLDDATAPTIIPPPTKCTQAPGPAPPPPKAPPAGRPPPPPHPGPPGPRAGGGGGGGGGGGTTTTGPRTGST